MKTLFLCASCFIGCALGLAAAAQTPEIERWQAQERRREVARADFERFPTADLEALLSADAIWRDDLIRAGVALRMLISRGAAQETVRVLLKRLDGNTERKRLRAENNTGGLTEWNEIVLNLSDGGWKVVPTFIATLAGSRIAASPSQQKELSAALRSLSSSARFGVAEELDRFLGTLPPEGVQAAVENLRANLGYAELPTQKALVPAATEKSSAELASLLGSNNLWKYNGAQAIDLLKILLGKDEPLAFDILALRFDGWSQNADWVDPSERPNEPYSLEEFAGSFDLARAQRFFDWLAKEDLDGKLTSSQRVRLGRCMLGCFGSREAFNAALLASAAKQPNSEEAVRRLRFSLATRTP